MALTLVKVDDRMIHGQVVIMWTKLRQGDRLIILVDDETAADEFLKKSIISGGNAVGKKTNVWDVQEALEKVPIAMASDKKYFVIARSIKQLYELYKAGIFLGNEIEYGTASTLKEGYVTVQQNINLSPEDIQMCEELDQMGVNITFRLIPLKTGTTYKKERERILQKEKANGH